MFSGLMASMMGAMITEMLNAQQAHSILFISLLLTITITMSCIIQFYQKVFPLLFSDVFIITFN